MKFKRLPNLLTFLRLGSSFIFAYLLVIFLPFQNLFFNLVLDLIFVCLSLTDFFDGYFARRYHLETDFGKALDHIADKFFVIACLLSLTYLNKIFFSSSLVLILREIFVLSVRNLALTKGFDVPVSIWGKVKVASHYLMIFVAILNTHTDFSWETTLSVLQLLFTLAAIFLSIYSGYLYFMEFAKKELTLENKK